MGMKAPGGASTMSLLNLIALGPSPSPLSFVSRRSVTDTRIAPKAWGISTNALPVCEPRGGTYDYFLPK
jgi:hypothetical protein